EQLDTKAYDAQNDKTIFEKWPVCTGGKPNVTDSKLSKFAKNERLTAHGGVAAILARSENEASNNPLNTHPILMPKNAKLLDEIANIEYERFKKSNIRAENFASYITKNFWPFNKLSQ
ncbi:36619_t:CDS:2, partial [Gigaspora margarita]